jgi:hypothetical protein
MITWEEWEATYQPTPLKDDNGYWASFYDNSADIPADIPEERIWTMIDGEGIYANLVNGIYYINSLGYFVTDVPWFEDEFVTNDRKLYA